MNHFELAATIKVLRIKREESLVEAESNRVTSRKTLKETVDDSVRLGEVDIALKQIQEFSARKTITFLQSFLTQGVNAVYHDREFEIVPVVGDRGQKKTLTLYVDEDLGDYKVRSLITQSGGGIQVVVAFLLQVLTIMNFDLTRVVILDEGFTQVSAEYVEGLFDLIDELIDKFGFAFMNITQDPRFVSRATRVYRVKKGEMKEVHKENL